MTFKNCEGKELKDIFLTNEEFMSRCVGTRLLSMGCNSFGKLGSNVPDNRYLPISVENDLNWATICAGENHSLAIKTDGSLWAWGNNSAGKLGTGDEIHRSSPTQTISCGTNWARISVSSTNSASIKCDGSLWTWGAGGYGQLGNGQFNSVSSPVQTVSGGTDWCRTDIGADVQIAIKCDGSLWTWGGIVDYTLPECTGVFLCLNSPSQSTFGCEWKDVQRSFRSNIGLKKDLTLWAWGRNYYGETGLNDNCLTRQSPIQISLEGKSWKKISGTKSGFSTAGIKVDGTLWTWGYNNCGQLNTLDTISRSSPTQTVTGGTNWKCVSVGQYSIAAINNENTMYIWGKQLGNPEVICCTSRDEIFVWGCAPDLCVTNCYTYTRELTRLRMNAQPGRRTYNNWVCISSHGINGGTCGGVLFPGGIYCYCPQSAVLVTKDDGSLWSWGCNRWGQLGNSSNVNRFTSLVPVCTSCTNWCLLCGYIDINGGVTTTGNLWLWGRGLCGGLGNNSTVNRSSPVQTISGGTNWRQFTVARRGVAAIKTDGTLWTWGNGANGQLGQNSTGNRSSPGQTAAGGTTWLCVASNFFSFNATKTDGSLWGWGDNRAQQVGVASPTTCILSPVIATAGSAGSDWVSVEGATFSASGLKSNGTIWTWGCVRFTGDGRDLNTTTASPVQAFGNDWCRFRRTFVNIIAEKSDGSLWTWGYNPHHGVVECTGTVCSPTQISPPGSTWKSFGAGPINGVQVAIRCCFQFSCAPYIPDQRPFAYTNIKSSSVGTDHILLTRFLGYDAECS